MEGGYAITFPDIPEALSQGETLQECLENAEDILSIAVEEYAAARRELPSACSLEQAKSHAAAMQAESGAVGESFIQLVQAPGVDTTPVRINISLPKCVLENIDRKARALGVNRSRFLADAAMRCA